MDTVEGYDTRANELRDEIAIWRQNHSDYPTRQEITDVLYKIGWNDVQLAIGTAIETEIVKEINGHLIPIFSCGI